jgi:hypothetical protein
MHILCCGHHLLGAARDLVSRSEIFFPDTILLLKIVILLLKPNICTPLAIGLTTLLISILPLSLWSIAPMLDHDAGPPCPLILPSLSMCRSPALGMSRFGLHHLNFAQPTLFLLPGLVQDRLCLLLYLFCHSNFMQQCCPLPSSDAQTFGTHSVTTTATATATASPD